MLIRKRQFRFKNNFSNNITINDFILKNILPNITIFSTMFLFGLPFFKISILNRFKISPSLLSISGFDILLFLTALFCLFIPYIIILFFYDTKIHVKNNKNFLNCVQLGLFLLTLILSLYIFFRDVFFWLLIFYIILFILPKHKLNYKNIFIQISFTIILFGLITCNIFIDNYFERFIRFNIIEANSDSKIINVVVAYYNDKPIIKQYDTTGDQKNYLNNFLPGYEYDGEKYSDVVFAGNLSRYFTNKTKRQN